MEKKNKKILIGAILGIILFGIAGAAHIYYYFFAQPFQITDTTYIYIDRDDDVDSVYYKIAEAGNPKQMHGFESLVRYQGYTPKTGRYAIKPTDNMRYLHRRLSMGYQPLTQPGKSLLEVLIIMVVYTIKYLRLDEIWYLATQRLMMFLPVKSLSDSLLPGV